MITIRVSSASIAALDARAKSVREAIKDLDDRRKLLTQIRNEQAERWAQDFLAGGNPTWEPSARVKREGGRTLMITGRTFAHFVQQNQAGRVNAASITWNFSNAVPASTVSHHTGYVLGGNTVPARTLWDFHPRDENIIEQQIEAWFAEKLGNL